MTNKTLMNAILAMDSYNRGYDSKIKNPNNNDGLGSATGTKIGNATINFTSLDLGSTDPENPEETRIDQNASFYAISYTHNDETIISYRGTDAIVEWPSDIAEGWITGLGAYASPQAKLSADFYKSVINGANPYNTNVEFVGHSLGGGLAGLMASLYDKRATVFDNMPFEEAADLVAQNSVEHSVSQGQFIIPADQELKDKYYFNGAIPQDPNSEQILAYATIGEVLQYARNASIQGTPVQKTPVDYLNSFSQGKSMFTELHSQALLVTLLYARDVVGNADWNVVGKELMDALFNNDIAFSLGIKDNDDPTKGSADKMLNKIAYSALHATGDNSITGGEITNDELVFGDTAIRALFNDANEFGKVLQSVNLPKIFQTTPIPGTPYEEWNIKAGVAKMLVQFAGKLAESETFYSDHNSAIEGMLNFSSESNTLTLNVSNSSNSLWGSSSPIEKQEMLNNLYAKFLITDLSNLPNANDVDRIIIATTNNGVTNNSFTENLDDTAVIFGAYGDDTLQGSDGSDVLIGGFGSDNLNGGIGNDILDGGAQDGNSLLNQNHGSSDTLNGGFGHDTYIFKGSFGSDTITDDGQGTNINGVITKDKIVINGQTIVGAATYVFEGVYQLGNLTLKTSNGANGGTLTILAGSTSNTITVENFTSEDFNITLGEKPENPTPPLDDLVRAEASRQAVRSDPLTLDLNHNGQIDLISLNNSQTFFDLEGSGFRNKVGWVNNGDGLLVLDENHNGVVDNIDELFGHRNADGFFVTAKP